MLDYPVSGTVEERVKAVTAYHAGKMSREPLRTSTPLGDGRVLEMETWAAECRHHERVLVGRTGNQRHFKCPDCKHRWSEDYN